MLHFDDFDITLIKKLKYPEIARNRSRNSPRRRNKRRLHLSRGEAIAESNKATRKWRYRV